MQPSVVQMDNGLLATMFIPGKPVPKGRPRGRVVQRPGKKAFVQFYTDSSTVQWESTVAQVLRQQAARLGLPLPFVGRCLVHLRFNLEKPKSTPKSVMFPVKSRTDVDNLAKAVLDGMQNAQILINDNIVTDLTVTKRYADDDHPLGVEVEITAL